MFDVTILGGGIAGLYIAYQLLKSKKCRVLLLERNNNRLGGRIYTYKDKSMTVESGAGRIHQGHFITLDLIREMKLEDKLVEIDNDTGFVDANREWIMGAPYRNTLKHIIREASKRDKSELISKTLFDFTKDIRGEQEAKTALTSFGYTTEFTHMNAYDAIELMKIIAIHQKYYVLSGGLSQLIDAMVERIRSMGGVIQKGQSVESIQHCPSKETPFYRIHCSRGNVYETQKCVCTMTVKDFASVRILGDKAFRENIAQWKQTIKTSIYGGSLCRIYSQFDGEEWFSEKGKMTVNNDLRMIIPIDSKRQIAMISYSDNAIANKWARLEEEGGIRAVNARLKYLIEKDIGVNVGALKHTRVFYWSDAVGYWKVGANSNEVERCTVNVFNGIYFCGENYSSKNQQWVEGALDTATRVLHCLI